MRITKKLTANDIGTTGGHQAGILVPKAKEILSFFPQLPADEKNPRIRLPVRERQSGTGWAFNYIYYNNKFFDAGGTRNEYRLTGMTAYLRSIAAREGDELEFTKDEDGTIYVDLHRDNRTAFELNNGVLHLGRGWLIIPK